MARMPKLVVPGYPHHVTQRGNRRQQTFFCEDDFHPDPRAANRQNPHTKTPRPKTILNQLGILSLGIPDVCARASCRLLFYLRSGPGDPGSAEGDQTEHPLAMRRKMHYDNRSNLNLMSRTVS